MNSKPVSCEAGFSLNRNLDNNIAVRYYLIVIESFASKETEKIFLGQVSKKLPTDIQRTARRKLLYLDDAENLQDIQAVPGNKFEKLRQSRRSI